MIDFPLNPTVGQIYDYDGTSYTWDGHSWGCVFAGITGKASQADVLEGIDELKYITPRANIISTTQLGTITKWGGVNPPPFWVECKGQATSSMRPEIQTIYGSNLPDLRGEFIRGWDHGRGIDAGRGNHTWQNESFATHSHSTTSNITTNGNHTHTYGASLVATGNHNHTKGTMRILASCNLAVQHNCGGFGNFENVFRGRTASHNSYLDTQGGGRFNDRWRYTYFSANKAWTGSTSSAGAHSHTITGTVTSVGNHTHNLSINVANTTDKETRPTNVSLMFICYVGV